MNCQSQHYFKIGFKLIGKNSSFGNCKSCDFFWLRVFFRILAQLSNVAPVVEFILLTSKVFLRKNCNKECEMYQVIRAILRAISHKLQNPRCGKRIFFKERGFVGFFARVIKNPSKEIGLG